MDKETRKCLFCDTEFEVVDEVNGECPNCKEKYEWGFDGDYEQDSVWNIYFLNAGKER